MRNLLTLFLFLIPLLSFSQNDCMGTENFNVNPQPINGGYEPGTVVEYCITYNNWNTGLGTNWFEGIDITIGPGWVANSIVPVTFPQNISGVGQWVWNPSTFNGNPVSSGGGGNQFGPGFFYDYNNNGQSVDDWGDQGNGPWTFCFEITVGNVTGSSLSLQVSAVSDGFAGSWGTPGCNGFYQTNLSPGNIVTGCLNPPVINSTNLSNTSCNGASDGSFDINVIGGTAPFTFTVNGNPETMPMVNITAGNYQVICIDNDGCLSQAINIVITENSPVVNNTVSLNDVLCFGEASGSVEISSNGGIAPYTYNLNGIINNTGIFNNLLAGPYNILVSDANGCNNNHNVLISEPTQVINQVLSITDVDCNGNSNGEFEVISNGGLGPYTYDLNGITNNTGLFQNWTANLYNVTVTDAYGCVSNQNVNVLEPNPILYNVFTTDVDCFGNHTGEINIIANGGTAPYNYTLNGLSNVLGQFNNLPLGNYIVDIVDDLGCQVLTNPIQINQPTNPLSTNQILTQPTCFGSQDGEITVNISGGTAPYIINWNTLQNTTTISGLLSGNYQANITDANGCQLVENIFLNQPSQIFVTVNNPTSICQGEEVILNGNQINAITPFNITWSNSNDLNIVNNNSTVSPDITTLYTANLTDANGCSANNIFVVTVNSLPETDFISNKNIGCSPLCVQFQQINPNPNYIWNWNFGDGSINNLQSPEHCYQNGGIYDITLSAVSQFGCVNSTTQDNYILVNQTPEAKFAISPANKETIENPDFEFINLSNYADDYKWSFGDGNTSQDYNTQHRYSLIDEYCVELIATANYVQESCKDTLIKCLEVTPISIIWVPNSFTPNNDGFNDVFFVKGTLISEFEIVIYNRWGEQVYRSFDIENGWTGAYGEQICPDGVYSYIIYYRDLKQLPYMKTGHVVLLR